MHPYFHRLFFKIIITLKREASKTTTTTTKYNKKRDSVVTDNNSACRFKSCEVSNKTKYEKKQVYTLILCSF